MMRRPLAPTVRERLGVSALAASVAAHLLIGALALLVVVHPMPPPAEPVPVQMAFAPLPDAAPAPAAEAPPPRPPPAPPSQAQPPPPPPPPLPVVADIAAAKPPVSEPAPQQQPPPRAASTPPARPPHRVMPRQPPSAVTEARPAVVAPSAAPVSSAASTPMPAPPPGQAQGEALAAWRGALAVWLSAHRRYPEQARRDGVQGQPTVRFTVEPSGRVTSVELVISSGSTVLDEATIAMLRGATLPPFPPGLMQTSRTETVRVHYALD